MSGDDSSKDTGLDTKDTQSTKSRRGKIVLHNLAKRKAKGIKLVVEFNKRGQPYGKVASEMQSHIGILAREKVKVCYESWKVVPMEIKETLWEHVNYAYEVQPSWKSGCMQSANLKWKQWKSKLYREHIKPNKDNPEKLYEPPEIHILREDWRQFVSKCTSPHFEILSEEQSDRALQNKYPHKLSRKGYVGLAEILKEELCGDDDIDRAIMWKKARTNKNGDIEDENLKVVVQKINDCIRQKEEGKLVIKKWGEDVLTCALDTAEHSGRVRAVGSYITPTVFFKEAKDKKQNMKDQLLELAEMKKLVNEQNMVIRSLQERMSNLETPCAKEKEIEGKGSCSVKQPSQIVFEDIPDDELVVVEKVDALNQNVENMSDVVSIKKKKAQQQGALKRKVKSYDNLPKALKLLYIHFEKSLTDGRGVEFRYDDHIFGVSVHFFIHKEDLIPFCDLKAISRNCVLFYTKLLYDKLKENDALDKYRFVDPFSISYMPNSKCEARAQTLADRMQDIMPNQLVIVPCNVGKHWIISVIDPQNEFVYSLDPLSHRIRADWKSVVNMALFLFKAKLGQRSKPSWEIIKAPRQPDEHQCGFFIMRYMKEIVEELLPSASMSLKSHFENRKYSIADIDDVRDEWANSVLLCL